MTGARAVVVGTIGIDFLSDSDHAPFARTSVGNSGANIAMRLAAAGFDTDLIALVGEDDLADAAREDLVAGGVDVEGVVSRRKYETPRVFHVVSDDPHLLFTCPVCGSPRGHALALPRIDEVPSAVLDRAARADLIVADVAGALTDLVFGRGESALRWYEQSLTEAGAADMIAVARAADIVKVSHEDESHFAP